MKVIRLSNKRDVKVRFPECLQSHSNYYFKKLANAAKTTTLLIINQNPNRIC